MRLAHKSSVVATTVGLSLAVVIGFLSWADWKQRTAYETFDRALVLKRDVYDFSSLAIETFQRPSKRLAHQWKVETASVRDSISGLVAEGEPDAVELDQILTGLSSAFGDIITSGRDMDPQLRRVRVGRLIARLQQMSEVTDRLVKRSRAARNEASNALKSAIWATIAMLVIGVPLLWIGFRTAALTPLKRLTSEVAGSTLDRPLSAEAWSRGDEFGQLGREFADMQARLLAAFNQLKDKAERLELTTQQAEATAAQARDAERSARAAAETKSRFLATISHEIRTPMNGIMGMSELLRATRLDDDQQQCADTIHDSATALLSLINDILDISRLDAGKVVLQSEPVNVTQLVEDVVQLLSHTASEKGIQFMVYDRLGDPGERDKDHGSWHLTDSARLRQILVNIVGNAVKFTLEGRVIVSVRKLTPLTTERPTILEFAVSDTGIGIASDKLDKIFLPFEQADSTISRRFEGTGLGLAISNSLVKAMGGEMSVVSAEGKGTTFTLLLPMEVAPSPEDVASPSGATLAGKTIAYVSDDLDSTWVVGSMLESTGLNVRSHAVPDIGVPQNVFTGADLVVFDMDVRGKLSEDAIKTCIHGIDPRIPCLVLYTSEPQIQITDRPVAMRRKPVRREALHDVVRQLIGESAGRPAQPDRNAEAEAPDLRGRLLLVAEDNKTNRLVMKKMLAPTGATVVFAENGQEAIETWRQQTLDLIFMDVSMPVMDGHEATREIRMIEAGLQDGRRCPIVAVTAHALPDDRARCLSAGMDFVLTKPIRKVDLFARLTDALPQRRESVEDLVNHCGQRPFMNDESPPAGHERFG